MKRKIKKIITVIIKIIYKLIYRYIPTNEKTIMFIAFHGRGYLCNPKYLHKYMSNDSRYSDFKFIWAIKKNKTVDILDAKIVKYNGIKYFYYLARSKYWVVNCKLPQHVLKKDEQIYLQTWHGTPLKRLAHDINIGDNKTFYRTEISQEEMVKSYDKDVKKYKYLVSPNKFSTDKFQSAFKIAGSKIIETGYPRNDYLVNIKEEEILMLKDKYNIDKDKKIILYAPTWRDNCYSNKGYLFELKANFNLWKAQLGEEYVVIFKPHYLIINNYLDNDLQGFLYNVKEDVDINELYVISDMLITDYSSVFFDYSLLNRPILFYMYDLDEYKDEIRGFYLDINKDLPGKVFKEEKELLDEVKNINEYGEKYLLSIEKFNEVYNEFQDGKSCEKVIDILL